MFECGSIGNRVIYPLPRSLRSSRLRRCGLSHRVLTSVVAVAGFQQLIYEHNSRPKAEIIRDCLHRIARLENIPEIVVTLFCRVIGAIVCV